MRVIRWGIIGCGDVTEVKSGPALQKAANSELVAVMRRDGAKAADYARRHNVPRWYDDADALLADKDINAIYVATPPGTHEFYAMKALAAGKPCYVEKPMARCAAEARRMVEAFQRAGLPLFIAYYRRALPRFLKAKEILESGVLGPLRLIGYLYSDRQMLQPQSPLPWRLIPEQSGGGPFLDLASHTLDLFDFFCGPLQRVEGVAGNRRKLYDVEDHVALSFQPSRVRCEIPATAGWNFAAAPPTRPAPPAPTSQDVFLFAGEKGKLQFSCFGNEPLRLQLANAPLEEFNLPNPPHIQQPLIETIVGQLLGAGPCPSTGESAWRTQIVMDQALGKYYGNRDDNFWTGAFPGRHWPAVEPAASR